LKIVVPSGSAANWFVYHDYVGDEIRNLVKQDFISWWVYGLNNSKTQEISFHTDAGVNLFYKQFTDNFTGWKRIFYRKDEFLTSGSPLWSSIKRIQYKEFSAAASTRYLDRACVGVGVLVAGPSTRYDGIYLIRDVKWIEEYKQYDAYPYEIELWLQDDYY